ncbi:STAS domain-containing protein [Methylovulum miyakonense]|uniref:STAS domain-containing protein n=1 Tax=Methylovulum miyakonense TaxID=645578 RepID=UPI00037DA462|nr:STAS domain-containing protein [Methylovulum miyakonense]
MDFKTKNEAGTLIVSVGGRLDTVTAPEYEKQIRALIDGGNSRFVVDFARLDYISSAGLRGLLVMAKLLNAKDGKVCFANVNGNVRSVFEMSGFNDLFKIENSVSEALATLA